MIWKLRYGPERIRSLFSDHCSVHYCHLLRGGDRGSKRSRIKARRTYAALKATPLSGLSLERTRFTSLRRKTLY